jgi:hypothetical protein
MMIPLFYNRRKLEMDFIHLTRMTKKISGHQQHGPGPFQALSSYSQLNSAGGR